MNDYVSSYSGDVIAHVVCIFIITTTIGLIPPFLVRCVISGRPLKRASALMWVLILLCVNLATSAALNSHSVTYAALIVVPWVSYCILRSGSPESQADEVVSLQSEDTAAATVPYNQNTDMQNLSRPLGERLIWPMVVLMCALIIATGIHYGLKARHAGPVFQPPIPNHDSPKQEGNAQSLDLVKLAEKVRPACVLIETFDREGKSTGSGSGFFINKWGQLITNYHVIAGASTARAKTITHRTYTITGVTAADKDADIISLRIDKSNAELPFLELAEKEPQVAESIALVGNPLRLDSTFTNGIVSAARPAEGDTSSRDLIQITAPGFFGSSGGPVVNMKGEVVGIYVGGVGRENLNFAIPCTTLQTFLHRSKVDFRLNPHQVTMRLSEITAPQPEIPPTKSPEVRITLPTVSRSVFLAQIDKAWDQEYEMIKRWWDTEEKQAKSLPTAGLRQQYDEQATSNFTWRDRDLKAKYAQEKEEAALVPERVNAEFLDEFWRLHRQQMQAREDSWQQSRRKELEEIWAWYEEQRKQEILLQRIDQLQRQIQDVQNRY